MSGAAIRWESGQIRLAMAHGSKTVKADLWRIHSAGFAAGSAFRLGDLPTCCKEFPRKKRHRSTENRYGDEIFPPSTIVKGILQIF
jgi:hypothetical protein